MHSIATLIYSLINLYIYIIIGNVVLSWLIAFGIVNMQNNVVRTLYGLFHQVTEPVMGPIRRLLPNLGGIDISPMIVLVALWFAQSLLKEYFGVYQGFI